MYLTWFSFSLPSPFLPKGTDNLPFARAELEKRVQTYAAATAKSCVLVWDALGQRGSGGPRAEEQRLDDRVSVVFSRDEEADSYIVRRSAQLKVECRAGRQ